MVHAAQDPTALRSPRRLPTLAGADSPLQIATGTSPTNVGGCELMDFVTGPGEPLRVETAVTPLQPLKTLGFPRVLPVTFTRYEPLREALQNAQESRERLLWFLQNRRRSAHRGSPTITAAFHRTCGGSS